MEVTVSNIRRTFGSTVAVDNLSFSFSSGDVCGFVGPNGAGKTTAIKVIATMDAPDSGDVLYGGVSAAIHPERVRPHIGYMPDSLPDNRNITTWEYIDFFARAYGLKGETRSRRIAEIEEFTGLGIMREKKLTALSKGMKQRVSLARALVHDPEILIMDEPAAGLDPKARIELRELIITLAKQGKGIFLSSHILADLDEICNKVVIIEKGVTLYAGSIDAVGQNSESVIVANVKLSADCSAYIAAITALPGVTKVRQVNDSELAVEFAGTESEANLLLKQMIGQDIPVCAFEIRKSALEDIFMNITRGEVQ